VTVVALTDAQLMRRFDGLVRFLDHWGDVQAADLGRRRGVRLLEFQLAAPGADLPIEVLALYREYYRRDREGAWEIAKYTYEYLDVVNGRRLAYHLHALASGASVAHAHCEAAHDIPDVDRSSHLRAHEYELREAHREFMRLWASGDTPDCGRLLPLRPERT